MGADLVKGNESIGRILKNAATLDDLAQTTGTVVVDAADFSDDLPVIENKDTLVGVPFVIVASRFNDGDFGVFVSLSIATLDDKGSITGRAVLNDGSTGIRQQFESLVSELPEGSLVLVKRGLRKSEYTYKDDKGKETPATTYYLNMA